MKQILKLHYKKNDKVKNMTGALDLKIECEVHNNFKMELKKNQYEELISK
jgi:hypothetical protein